MTLSHLLNGNQFFSGGLALGVIATAAAFLRRYIPLLFRRFVVDIEVREWDMVRWLGLWLAHTDYGKRCRKLSVKTINTHSDDASVFFEPGLGPHLFRYEGAWILVDRRIEKEENVWNRSEWYFVRILGSRAVGTQLVETAKEFGTSLLARKHSAYISDGKGDWKQLSVGTPRPLDSVILPGTLVEDLMLDVRTFFDRRDWYRERGIPHRRGYELSGPPRTGKTSLVRAMCAAVPMPLYVLDLSSSDLHDYDLTITLGRVPAGSAVLIEDIDAVSRSRETDATKVSDSDSKVTLSGLLNALDGPLTSEGRILFVTTNHPERLDPALRGEGRLDVHVKLTYADRDQIIRLFLRFFPDRTEEAELFAEIVPAGALSPAAIQEHLLARSDDPERALSEAPQLARKEVHVVDRERAA
jgi:chaperone BCS1